MPRKFLGEKIERGVDVVRPASLTLTSEDLANIPVFPSSPESDTEDKVNYEGEKSKRLSRKFGGTIKLKQRLESVPELFLHDFGKKKRVPPRQKKIDENKAKRSFTRKEFPLNAVPEEESANIDKLLANDLQS